MELRVHSLCPPRVKVKRVHRQGDAVHQRSRHTTSRHAIAVLLLIGGCCAALGSAGCKSLDEPNSKKADKPVGGRDSASHSHRGSDHFGRPARRRKLYGEGQFNVGSRTWPLRWPRSLKSYPARSGTRSRYPRASRRLARHHRDGSGRGPRLRHRVLEGEHGDSVHPGQPDGS